jgi:hypothetical protein
VGHLISHNDYEDEHEMLVNKRIEREREMDGRMRKIIFIA